MSSVRRSLNVCQTIIEKLITAVAIAGVLCFAVAAALTVANIIGRQFGLPIFGVVDLVKLLVLSGAWLVIPYTFVVRGHVSVDLLVDTLPNRIRQMLRILAGIVALALLSPMLVECFHTYQQQAMLGDSSNQLGIPIKWYWIPLLIGVAISIVSTILTFFNYRDRAPRA